MSVSSVPGRHVRMLQILGHLQSGGGLNADELAGQLDVCRRTIFRDLSLMREAGIEIYFDENMDCYRLPPQRDLVVMPTLEHEELTTLIAAVHLSRAAESSRLQRLAAPVDQQTAGSFAAPRPASCYSFDQLLLYPLGRRRLLGTCRRGDASHPAGDFSTSACFALRSWTPTKDKEIDDTLCALPGDRRRRCLASRRPIVASSRRAHLRSVQHETDRR